MLLTIIAFILILGLLVLAHELGHFLTARKLGVKCDEFGFGFPPRLFGFYKNREGKWRWLFGRQEAQDPASTIYSLNALPIGGFVKIKGENGEGQEDYDSFAHRSIWQRAMILSAGVSMNVILAAALISLGLMIGLPQVLEDISPRAKIISRQIQVVDVLPDSPAKNAGFKLADIIVSLDNQQFTGNQQIIDYVNQKINQPIDYRLLRAGQYLDIKVTPQLRTDTGQGGIGVAISEIGRVRYPWYLAIWEGCKSTILLLWAIILGFIGIIRSLLAGQGAGADIAGPIGIVALTNQMVGMGFIYVLQFTAILSLNLAIINFLPVPALDGGRLLFLIIEKIKGSPIKREAEALIHNIGFLLLMLLVVLVTFKDVGRFGCLTCRLQEFFDSFFK